MNAIVPPFQGLSLCLARTPGRCPGLSHYAPMGLEVLNACQQILSLQIRKVAENFVDRITTSQVFQHGFHGIAFPANARFPVADFWIDGDPVSQALHVCNVQESDKSDK